MATLKELSGEYLEAAARLRCGIQEAQAELKRGDGESPAILTEKLRLMKQMLQEMRDLRELTEHYYTGTRDGKYTTFGLRASKVNKEKEK